MKTLPDTPKDVLGAEQENALFSLVKAFHKIDVNTGDFGRAVQESLLAAGVSISVHTESGHKDYGFK